MTVATLESLRRKYTAGDRQRICLAEGEHPKCGPYLCQLSKGHAGQHQSACRKHHCCLISWADERTDKLLAEAPTTIGGK